jgi:energy-coupling factor transporter transmembrane protein EcfT
MKGKGVFMWITVLLSAGAMVLSLALPWPYLVIPVLVLLGVFSFNLKPAGRVLLRLKIWVLVLSPFFFCAFLIGPKDTSFVSRAGLICGSEMAVRAFCIVLSVALVTGRISIDRILRFFRKGRMKGFGLALGVAYNMLFELSRSGRVVFETLRLRGAVRRRPFKAFGLFIECVICNALDRADDIVHAATARGFDTGE